MSSLLVLPHRPHQLLRPAWHQIRLLKQNNAAHVHTTQNNSLSPQNENSNEPKFETLGLHPPIVAALQKAFPHIKGPTAAQEKFIPAILGDKDVLLKDATGTGKSFGLLVALLNKPRTRIQGQQDNVTSLIVVPHRGLGHQFVHWIEQIHSKAIENGTDTVAAPLASIVQLLVRDGKAHLTTGISLLKEVKPHILIGTPQALLDVYRTVPGLLQLQKLSSVVVDEVDYLIPTVPKKDPSKSFKGALIKAQKKLAKHPGETRELLNIIYAQRFSEDDLKLGWEDQMKKKHGKLCNGPQLVLSSATLRKGLTNYLYEESGYLRPNGVLKISGETIEKQLEQSHKKVAGLGGDQVTHHVLVVSNDGIRNIENALPAPESKEGADSVTLSPAIMADETAPEDLSQPEDWMIKAYRDQPSTFDPNTLEAVATTFALDVSSVALLVLPASAGVQRAVYELREMGVNAEALDARAASRPTREEARLMVCTEATIRGMDLPAVEHVFVLGILSGGGVTGRSVDGYVHIAGRVGRLGGRGRGKVISVVSAGEEKAMGRILGSRLGVTATKLQYFD